MLETVCFTDNSMTYSVMTCMHNMMKRNRKLDNFVSDAKRNKIDILEHQEGNGQMK